MLCKAKKANDLFGTEIWYNTIEFLKLLKQELFFGRVEMKWTLSRFLVNKQNII